MHLDFCRRSATRFCSVQGELGELRWDLIENYVRLKLANSEEETWCPEFDRYKMFRDQLQHFFDCVENGRTPRVTLEDGIAALKVVSAAKISSESQRAVAL